jgi:hypothetical protein
MKYALVRISSSLGSRTRFFSADLVLAAFWARAAGAFLAGPEPFLFARADGARSVVFASAFDSAGDTVESDAAAFFEDFFDLVATFTGFTDDAALRK